MFASVKYAWKKRTLRFFIIGIVIAELTTVLWMQFYSILLYSAIGKTDEYIGLLYSSEVIITSILIGLLGILAGKVTKLKFWYLVSLLLTYPTFYFGLSYFLEKKPVPESFDIYYTAIFLGILFLLMIPYNFNYILYFRTILDLMPERYRGSMYSLISTLKSVTGAIILFVFGKYLIQYSLSQSFYYLGLVGLLGSIIIFFSLIRFDL